MAKVKVILENGQELEVDMSQKSIEELIKVVNHKDKSIYDLKVNDTYWFVNYLGAVEDSVWENDKIEKHRLDTGNVFLTKEEALNQLRINKFLSLWKREYYERGWKPDWLNTSQYKWYVSYAPSNQDEIVVDWIRYQKILPDYMYFQTKEQANIFMIEHEEELELYLEVE